MILREPQAFSADSYDVIVVGGGVYGVMLALEAAHRGLRPLLLERGDFGAETSANSLRIIHGGLRYLQTLDFRRFHESVQERAWLLTTFPDQVRPLRCLMPLYGEGMRRSSVFRAALAINAGLGWLSGNRGDAALEPGRVLGAEEARRELPMVPPDGLRGAAVWYDAVLEDSERLIIDALRWACAAGARALNHVEAVGLFVDGDVVQGVTATDLVTGDALEYRAPKVVNAAGPWARELAARFDRDPARLWRPTTAFNVALRLSTPLPGALALTPRAPGASTYFLHPWKGGVLAGTVHGEAPGPSADTATDAEVESLRRNLAASAPGLGLDAAAVARVYRGLLPGHPHKPGLATRPVLLDHGSHGGPRGLISVSGVKFTTARRVAEKVVKHLASGVLPAARRPPRPVGAGHADRVPSPRLFRENPARAVELCRTLVSEESVVTAEDLQRRVAWGPFVDPPPADLLAGLPVLASPLAHSRP